MIASLVRPNIRDLKPYSCARDLYKEGVLLDANENPFPSSLSLSVCDDLNRYPDPENTALKRALSELVNVDPFNIFVGVGSNEVIDLLVRLFVSPDENVMIFEPTYGMYRIAAEICGVKTKACQLDANFQIDFSAFQQALTEKTKLIFLCSPNSPTGNLLKVADIEKICASFNGIVVLDEAYVEFSSQSSLVSKIGSFPNLVIVRTLSKAWGLAALRVGYAVANREIIEYLNRIKPPYNLNGLSSFLAAKALENPKKLKLMVEKILLERKRMESMLKQEGVFVFPSETNFLLLRVPDASQVAYRLAKDFGIIVRDFSGKPRLANCLRVTVGKPEENDFFIQSLLTLV